MSEAKCEQLFATLPNNSTGFSFEVKESLKILGCVWNRKGLDYNAMKTKLVNCVTNAIAYLTRCFNSNATTITRANAYKTFVQPITQYFFNFIILDTKTIRKLEKQMLKFINCRPVKGTITKLSKNRGGLQITSLRHRNMATMAHWIIRAYKDEKEWTGIFKRTITKHMNKNVNTVNNCVVRNALIAWKYLNLGDVQSINNTLSIKELCNRKERKSMNVRSILKKKVNTVLVEDTNVEWTTLDLGKIGTKPTYYWTYLRKMSLTSKARQLRWRYWLHRNYLPIKRINQTRIRCSNCNEKLSYDHMFKSCSLTLSTRNKFAAWAATMSGESFRTWHDRWRDDKLPTELALTGNPLLEGIDTLMCTIKFAIWSKFASYMFGNKPNVFIHPKYILRSAVHEFIICAKKHGDTQRDASCPFGWTQLLDNVSKLTDYVEETV